MDKAFLEELGLKVSGAGGVVEAELELSSGQALNPLTRQFIRRAKFTVMGDRLFAIDPPELVGGPPINLAHITRASALEDLIVRSLNESIFQVQRRSAELASLGIAARTDPVSLQLSAELDAGEFHFSIGCDRLGHFRVTRVLLDGNELTSTQAQTFELSEFREKAALEGYLYALFSDLASSPTDEAPAPAAAARPAAKPDAAVADPAALTFQHVVAAFGTQAMVPPRSQVEVLVELRVGREVYRFAAARVAGKTFRGLIAGKNGKVWADRFEIDEFPGIRSLLAGVLGVSADKVEVVG